MEAFTLAKCIGIGAALAAPIGPMGMLCMRRTLTKGWRLGMSTGLGIATGDATYALVAALGLSSVSRFMLAYDRPLHFVAGAFLLYLGLAPLLKRTRAQEPPGGATPSATTGYASALLLTLTNPPTIIAFAAVFTVLAPARGFSAAGAAQTVAGVFIGSTLWWLALTTTVACARGAIGTRARRVIDIVSSTLLGMFGVAEIRRSFESVRS